MKKIIRNILSIGFVATVMLGLPACSDLLDQEPQGKWVEGDGSPYQSDVFSLYTAARNYHVTAGVTAFAIHSFRSEDAEKGSTASDGAEVAKMYDDFIYDSKNSVIRDYWTKNYAIILTANKVINAIQADIDAGKALPDGADVNKGEAHFFRAFAYFNLVRAFGDIPLVDFTVQNAAETNIPKSKASDIYALIDKDLNMAESILPQTWEKRYIGRVTWGAAKSLHARTYMMRNDWGNMYGAASAVMSSGLYDLSTPFDKIFRESSENGKESIFELQSMSTNALPESTIIGSQFAQVQGVRGGGNWDLGWGYNTPTQILYEAFEPNDPRRDETVLYFLKPGQDPNSIPANKPYGEKPIANSDVINKYYNKKAYTSPQLRSQYALHGFWFNIRLIRYADVVLMAAEAANELGNTTEALKDLEMIRARARGVNSTILPEVTTTDKEELRQAIRHERRVELAMEFDRFYDLVRWGIAGKVLKAAGKDYQEKNALLPIPQDEIDKSNGVLVQNPNY